MIRSGQNPADVYHAFALEGVEALNECKGFRELPLGEGNVDRQHNLKALKGISDDGF